MPGRRVSMPYFARPVTLSGPSMRWTSLPIRRNWLAGFSLSRVTWGMLAEISARMPQVTRDKLKPASQFRLIGKDVQRIDGPDKVTGRAKYGIDTRLPGMLYATVLRAPVNG